MAVSAPEAASDRHRRRRRCRVSRSRRGSATRSGDEGRATVTLVDRLASHLWKPLLHEIAAGRMDADVHDVDYVLMAYWHHFRFRQGAVIGLDRARRELKLDRVLDEEGTEILPQRDRALRHADLLRRQRQQRLRNARRRRTRDLARHRRRRRAFPSPAARGVRARRRARRAWRIAGGRHRDHRRRRHRRRARRGDPPLHEGARELRPRESRSGARHPSHADRSRAAHPAAALRLDRRRGNRSAREARRRGAHRRARHRDRRSRRAHGERRACSMPTSSSGRPESRPRRGSPSSTGSKSIARTSSSSTRRSSPRATRTSSRWATAPRVRGPRRVAKGRSCRRARRLRGSRRRCSSRASARVCAGRPLPTFHFHDFGSLVSLGELSAVGIADGAAASAAACSFRA